MQVRLGEYTEWEVCNSVKTIIAISVISMLALGMSIFATGVYAQGSAYTKGYKDALCDAVSCNGHGYEPSCPGDHSGEYCSNYRDGYATGWAATNSNSNGQLNSPPPPFSQAPNQDQGQSQSQGSTNNNNNNPIIIINPPK